MSDQKATMDIHTGRVSIPMPPPPTAAQNAAPTPAAPAAPAVSATSQTPSLPAATTPPQAAAPAQPALTYVDMGAMAQAKVDGKTLDVPVKELVANYQMRTAAEKRLAEANRLQNQYADQVRLGSFIEQNLRSNPDAVMAKLRELGLQGGGATATETDDDSVSPEIRQVRAQLAQIQAQNAQLNQFVARAQTEEKVSEIRQALGQFPLYQGDADALAQAEVVVAAYLVKDPSANVVDIAGELHSKQAAMLQRRLTNERDTRTANVQNLASVPPSAGTPGMTEQTIPKPTGAQLRDGSWKRGFDDAFSKLLRGT